jgi:hypothetical protein
VVSRYGITGSVIRGVATPREVAVTLPDLLVPAGATAHDWCCNPMGRDGELIRYVSWSSHDAAGVTVAVDSAQYPSGLVERHIQLYEAGAAELSAAEARQLASALLAAADVYDNLP